MRSDISVCLPRSTALLFVSTILQLASAHIAQRLPRKTPEPTVTIPHRALNVASWPLRPTPPPGAKLFAFRRQQLEENTICGYIGGDAALPATCGAGSHCVVDTEHNVVGCCPNGIPTCTAGIFTGCVDANSGPQTEVNPYIFSCRGDSVCYRNIFDGGYSQYGCGTASDLAATVLNSASGVTNVLARPTVSVSYTQGISTLSEPTTLGTAASLRTASSSSSPSPSSTVEDPDATTTSSATASPSSDSNDRTGAIVGGTIGGLAVLIALAALAFFFLRRRNANVRQGPGPGGVRGKSISAPWPSGGTGFAALSHDDSDAFETGPVANPHAFYQDAQPPHMAHIPPAAAAQHPATRSMLPPIATGPRMPFQNEISPVDQHDLDTPFAYNESVGGALASGGNGGLSAGATSVSSYSAGGISGVSDASAMQHYPGPHPASYAGGSGLLMGLNPLLLNRGAERQLESDQVPLTGTTTTGTGGGGTGTSSGREPDDFSHGFHAALGRIGEEDEEDEDDGLGQARGQGQGQGQGPGQAGYGDHVATGVTGGDSGLAGQRAGEETGGSVVEGRPLWQQNRRQSRNLMWM